MPDSTNVVTFARPGAVAPDGDFSSWTAWAECEFAILGGEMAGSGYDWQAAFRRGLRPEEAAAEAAGG